MQSLSKRLQIMLKTRIKIGSKFIIKKKEQQFLKKKRKKKKEEGATWSLLLGVVRGQQKSSTFL